MDRRALLSVVSAVALVAVGGLPARAETVLNVVTAGDQNMVDYVNQYLGPMFEAQNPGVKVRAAGTGPGDAGSQKIFEKLDAQAKAGTKSWDIDVAVVHQKMAGTMVKDDLLAKYRRPDRHRQAGFAATTPTTRSASRSAATSCRCSTARSRSPTIPPSSQTRPRPTPISPTGCKQNPKQFGYNGIKGGMSGVGFVMGWACGPQADAEAAR